MVLLKDIYIENFMSIDQLSISFEDDSIIAITGENGGGKSALLYAIAFALTGYKKGEKYQDYVKAGSDFARIILNADLKGYPLTIECSVTGGSKRNSNAPTKRTATYKGVTYINSDYDQLIMEHDLEYLESLMFLFQGKSDQIINMRPSERSYALRRIFKFDFAETVASLKSSLDSLKLQDAETGARLKEVNSRTYEKQKLLRTVTPEGLEKLRVDLEDTNQSLNKVSHINENHIESFNKRLSDSEVFLESQKNKLSKTVKDLETHLKEKENLSTKINEFDEDKTLKELSELSTYSEEFRNSIDILCTSITSASELKKVLNYHRNELESQLKICESGVCHSCGHEITPEHVEKIKAERDKAVYDFERQSKVLDNLIKDRDEEQKKLKEVTNKIQKINSVINDIESSKKQLSTTELLIKNYEKDIEDKKSIISRAEQDLSKLLEERNTIEAAKVLLEQKKDLENKRDYLVSAISKGEQDAIRNAEKRAFNEQIDRYIEERDANIKKLTKDQNDIALEVADVKACIDIFDTSFPNFIIVQACKKLEEYINNIMQKIFPSMRVTLKTARNGVSFFFVHNDREDDWIPISMASGAQKTLLGLAYQVALGKMYGINCILLDEADAAMSEENAQFVYKLISELDDFQQVIFVSHRKESIDVARNSNRDNNSVYYVSNGQYELR